MTYTKNKFLAPEKLDQAAQQIAALAKNEGASVALIGGYALQLYGSDRLTGDIDVIGDHRAENMLPRGKPLSFGRVQTRAPNGVPVDLVVRDDVYAGLYEEALNKAARMRGVPMLVARPEHIAAMKLAAGRARDMADLEWLILTGTTDAKKTHVVFRRTLGAYAAQEWDRLVEEVKWRASRGMT
jgi:hypothetical protein